MKIFLSAIENQRDSKANGGTPAVKLLVDHGVKMKWNLMSYYYLRKNMAVAEMVRDHSEAILIDSGAHSFQKGVHVKWEEYTEQYAAFIKEFDRPNVLGYFEMDVDNVIGYDAVKSLRSRLERVTDKVIPVWHKNRGIDDFKAMCDKYAGRIVAITGFKNEDIRDEQYMLFLNYAHSKGCKVHCLGMTRKKVLDKVPFDYSDSSSWVQDTLYGKINGRKVSREQTTVRRGESIIYSYLGAMEMQRYYHRKWQSVCRD